MENHWLTFERITIAFFTALAPTLMAAAALIAAIRAYRQSERTFFHVDSRMDQLLQEARDRARLEGVLEGQADAAGVLKPPLPPSRTERGFPHGPRTDLPAPPDASR
jgi:uncharacterized protein (DUF3084 family)